MAFRYGYLLPGAPQNALGSPAAKRLRAAWPRLPDDSRGFQCQASGHQTLMSWPRYDGAAVTLEHFGAPRACEDGLTYLPSLEPATVEDLIRPEKDRPQGGWMASQGGESLWISLALATPRQLLIGTKGFKHGRYATEFGLLAHDLFEVYVGKEGLLYADPRTLRLMQLTLQAAYHTTEEMIEDDIFHLSDKDVQPILDLVFGTDPKPLAAEPAPLPSAPAPTPMSP